MNSEEYEFLKNRLDFIKRRAFSFQTTCDEQIENKNNIILSMPTGSGKTDRFMAWAIANLLKENGSISKVIITSPIKALSNQRFRELYLLGYNVGIETGDVNYNIDDCTFLCCTQEIATNKYINDDVITIIDEFHYIYSDFSRSRTYIYYVINSKSKYLFLCSATFGDLNNVKNYLDKISSRNFFVFECSDRLTNIIFNSSIKMEDIKNAYVVSFSSDKCFKNANRMRNSRMNTYNIDNKSKQIILRTASKYDIKNDLLIINALYGIAYYFGTMLPKERLFILELFQNRLIDTVFGTDAISLGVNFPIQNIVFTSLRKTNSIISKNLFDQIVGRAGRYGLYNDGYVYYCSDFQNDDYLASDYEKIIMSTCEDAKVKLMPSIKNILSGKKTIDEEIRYVQDNSTDIINYEELLYKINNSLDIIRNFNIEESIAQFYFFNVIYPKKYKNINFNELPTDKVEEFKNMYAGLNRYTIEFYEQIVKLYNDEFSALENCIILRDIICNFSLDTILKDSTFCFNGDYKKNFRMLLQIRKYLNCLPEEYRSRIDLVKLDTIISSIDVSVFDVKLSFQEYSNFDIYNLSDKSLKVTKKQDLSELIIPKKEVKKTIKKQDIDKNKKKDIIKDKTIEKLFKEGTIIKEAGAPFAAPKYLVLLYSLKECVLLNYSSYQSGIISMSLNVKLNNYFQIGTISDNEYKKVLSNCKNNSLCFYSSENSSRKDINKIDRILKKTKNS